MISPISFALRNRTLNKNPYGRVLTSSTLAGSRIKIVSIEGSRGGCKSVEHLVHSEIALNASHVTAC